MVHCPSIKQHFVGAIGHYFACALRRKTSPHNTRRVSGKNTDTEARCGQLETSVRPSAFIPINREHPTATADSIHLLFSVVTVHVVVQSPHYILGKRKKKRELRTTLCIRQVRTHAAGCGSDGYLENNLQKFCNT